jgi:2-phospho-L-lactate guanylyltransferase (CobY/MobA/RfbA family)
MSARIRIIRNERIALDVDEPKDLRAAADRVLSRSATARVMQQLRLGTID